VVHCRFCEIVRKDRPASCVYEDERALAFLDIRPIEEGHTLVITKEHYENIHDMPDEEVAHLFLVVKKVANAVKKSLKAEGISLFQNNGSVAGQVVFHIHVHIIPRGRKHEMRHRYDEKRGKLDEVAIKIAKAI
jgi:histidine triad (HIT) family protein